MKDTRGLEHGVVLMNHSPHIHSRDMHGECQAWHFNWIQEGCGRVLEMTFDVKWEKEAWTLVNIVTAYPPHENVWRRLSVTLCVASTSMRARTRPICTHGMNKRCCGGCIIVWCAGAEGGEASMSLTVKWVDDGSKASRSSSVTWPDPAFIFLSGTSTKHFTNIAKWS